LYQNVLQMCIDVQSMGPWAYTEELKDPSSPEAKMWFMLIGAESIGYDREMDLNDSEFVDDVERIMRQLKEGVEDPDSFFEKSRQHLVEDAKTKIRFDKEDKHKRAPIGEGFASFVPMAIQGYEAGVVQDAEGWVFVGARGEISDELVESVGLTAKMTPDDRDPNRMVTMYSNSSGQEVIKKIHPGLLVVLSKRFDIAAAIAEAVNDERDAIKIADEATEHVRVIQSSEKDRDGRRKMDADEHERRKSFLENSGKHFEAKEGNTTTALVRPLDEFYESLLFIRGNYTYLDALRMTEDELAETGRGLTEPIKNEISKFQWEKMRQKVEEVRYVNELIKDKLADLPGGTTKVIDMAGGAGDLGLGVASEMMSLGMEVDGVCIVDPQEGVNEFMRTIINYLPQKEKLQEVATHALDDGTGFLQDTEITKDSVVVAKHACGVLTDAVIDQWRQSESPMLVAMTCCQGKAAGEPARYGLSQEEWSDLCVASDKTNTKTYGLSGKELEVAQRKLDQGMKAMKKLDMARVEYLRRHGFAAELDITDKFPKGDTIIARRLPENFMDEYTRLRELEKNSPRKFEKEIMKIDVIASGGSHKGDGIAFLGDTWKLEDYVEMSRRFMAQAYEDYEWTHEKEARIEAEKLAEQEKIRKAQERKLMKTVFAPFKGRIDMYLRKRHEEAGIKLQGKDIGRYIQVVKQIMLRDLEATPDQVIAKLDEWMEEVIR
jgi:hypothetical protein